MTEQEQRTNWYIYYAAFSSCFIAFASGGCYTWTSPILPKLNSTSADINPIGRPITISESAWIVSMMNLAMIAGAPAAVLLSRFASKKKILLMIGGPLLLAHAMLMFADRVIYFLIARFLMGFACGIEWSVLPTYVAEISEDKNRGLFGALAGVMSTAGLLLSYCVGPFVSITMFCCVNIATVILYYALFWAFVPDSPYDLISSRKFNEAEQSLIRLRRTKEVEKELHYMSSLVESSNDKQVKDLFRDPGLSRALKICVALMIIQQGSGIIAVSSYAQSILQLSGTTIPSDIGAIIMGTVSLISGIISSTLIDKMGRRLLLIISCSASSLAMFGLGAYFFLGSSSFDTSGLYWLPLTSLMVFLFAYNLGLIILPFVVVGELFSSNVKAAAATIATLCNYCMSFIVAMFFPYLIEFTGISTTFLIFGVLLGISTLFCLFKLPETKGKSFQDIQIMLNTNSKS